MLLWWRVLHNTALDILEVCYVISRGGLNGAGCIQLAHRKPYPSDISDEEWSLVVPHLTLMTERRRSATHPPGVLNGLRYVIRYGIAWRAMPNDFPPQGCGVLAIPALTGSRLL